MTPTSQVFVSPSVPLASVQRVTVMLIALAILPTEARAELPADCTELSFALTDHTCFHARFGPFVEVTATDGTAPGPATPSIDRVHTFYRIERAPGRAQVVTHTPAQSGIWAVFVDPDVAYSVRGPEGAPLEVLLEHGVEADDCPFLARVRAYELEAGTTYRYVFEPSTSTAVVVLNEKVDDFVVPHGRDQDGDGHGAPEGATLRACVPIDGYVENDDDCDDGDPTIHPGAIELCDGVDQDCDLVVDDLGARCTAGVGACEDRGVTECTTLGAPATCGGAVPGTGEAERCDGVDNDCDGVLDDGELCADAEAPRCVRLGAGRGCGCNEDADCGGSASGRLCLVSTSSQRCVEGCIDGYGRNGCPAGMVCTSADAFAPGTCVDACNDDDACPGGRCSASGRCVAVDAGPAGLDGGAPDAGRAGEGPIGCGCAVAARGPSWRGLFMALVALALARRRASSARRDRTERALVVIGLLVVGLTGCARSHQSAVGVPAEDAGGAGLEPACVPQLGDDLVRHACLHVERGSPREVLAATSIDARGPDVSSTHVAFRVVVSELDDSGSSATHAGYVEYRASRDGDHVVLLSEGAAIDALGPDGAVLDAVRARPVRGCMGLQVASILTLRRGERYRFALRSRAETLVLFVEHAETYGAAAWTDRCD